MIALFAVGIIFRCHGYLSGSEFVDLLKSTTISFFAANGMEHVLTTVQSYMNNKGKTSTQPAPDADGVAVADDDEDDSAASEADAKASK
jgi:hypothetical protein